MAEKNLKTEKILFFGAGKGGGYWLRICREFGILPEGILDNNKDLWGTAREGVPIYSPERIKSIDFEHIFLTCVKEQEMIQQLNELGISDRKIISGHHILNTLLYHAANAADPVRELKHNPLGKGNVVFDLSHGMVLGGVESWSYALAKRLKAQGYEGMYLTTDMAGPVVVDETYPACMLEYENIENEKEKIDMCVQKIIHNRPCTVICNFPWHIFWSACIAKKLYPHQIRIIAVQHSDDQSYYDAYSLWQSYIDKCMVISIHIEQKLLSMGMRQDKITHLEWKVPCHKLLDKAYFSGQSPMQAFQRGRQSRAMYGENRNEHEESMHEHRTSLQIGYAGRVTMMPKRIDLFLTLARNLKEKGLDFQINIAGTGDYSDTLQQEIQEKGLQNYIRPIGCIDRRDIPAFWNRQHIMISCSEIEGHSISQSEAMAEGAVPVITDISGARDDVTDGYNGFIVDVGDVETMTERILYLYHNPDILEQMGKRAHDTIYNRQKDMDETAFWDHLLKEVWEQ